MNGSNQRGKRAAKQTMPKGLVCTDSQNTIPDTLSLIQESQENLTIALANIFANASPTMKRYIIAVVNYLAQFLTNRVSEGMYSYLANTCDVQKLAPHRVMKHRYARVRLGSVGNNRYKYYQDVMFGTDALRSWSSTFDPSVGKYRNNIELWTTLFVISLLTPGTRLDYEHIDYDEICRYVHWSMPSNIDSIYQQAELNKEASSSTFEEVAEEQSGERGGRARHPDEDDDDDDDGEYENEEETNPTSLSLSFGKDSSAIIGPVCEERSVAIYQSYCILPFVLWKSDLTSEETITRAYSNYLDSNRHRMLSVDKKYTNVMMGHTLVEGVHFDSDGGSSVPVVTIPDGVAEALREAFSNEVDSDFNGANAFVGGNLHRTLDHNVICEDFVNKPEKAPKVVNIGRFFLSPSYSLSLCALYSKLNPIPASREEALQLFAEKSLRSNRKEKLEIEERATELRKQLATCMTSIAEYNIREKALRYALASNMQEILRRVEDFGFQMVDVTAQGHLFIQTGPQFGTFTSAKYTGQRFYVGNFQIIMCVTAASFVIRNIEAPVVVATTRNDAKPIALMHPHSDDGDDICWGGYSSELGSIYGAGEYPLADDFDLRLRTLMMFLTTANRDDGYVTRWLAGMSETIPPVTATTQWDTSMKISSIPMSTIIKSTVKLRWLADDGHNINIREQGVRVDSEEGLKWIS